MNILLLTAWNITKVDGAYYTLQIHKLYIDNACNRYDKVYIIAPVKESESIGSRSSLIDNRNLRILPMPNYTSYLSAQKYIFNYYRAIIDISKKVELIYCRVPDPFSWMPALLTNKPVIMHFVGDTIDATQHNQLWSPIKRKLMIAAYQPEYSLIIKATRKATKVLTNGEQISSKLNMKGICARAVISSTVSKNDLPVTLHQLQRSSVRITYIGLLRGAKGIDTLIETVHKLQDEGVDFFFNIVGDGDYFNVLQDLSREEGLVNKIKLWGFVNDRNQLFEILRNSDLFFFPSLSEGSPRVVIEAMSQGVPVLSTPVGSLPYTFEDHSEIRFFPINDAAKACDIIHEYTRNSDPFDKIRHRALKKVREKFTTEIFFDQIFKL